MFIIPLLVFDIQDDILHPHNIDMDDPPPRQRDLPLPSVPLGAMVDRGVDMDHPPPTVSAFIIIVASKSLLAIGVCTSCGQHSGIEAS